MDNPFDARAKTWDEDPRRVQLAADLFAALAQQVPLRSDISALDYGCGTGLLTLALAPRVRRVLAVDSSQGMLEVLAQKAKACGLRHVQTLCANFANDPAPSGAHGLIASAMALHHVAETETLLRNFFALLAPGGSLALADLDAEDGSFHGNRAGIPHFGFDRAQLARQLATCGFEDIQFITAARIEKNSRTYPVFLATARKPG